MIPAILLAATLLLQESTNTPPQGERHDFHRLVAATKASHWLLAASPDELTLKITALDAEVFDAYNKCDLAKFASFLAEDLEFYHDQGGLSVGRQATVEAVKNNICGKVHRDLVPGTLAAYPLKGYGAVETGIHVFCDPKSIQATGKCGEGSGVARFTHLWQNKDGVWKITRVISYDHCNGCSTSIPPDFRVVPVK